MAFDDTVFKTIVYPDKSKRKALIAQQGANIVIPEGVTTIDSAFADSQLTSVVFQARSYRLL